MLKKIKFHADQLRAGLGVAETAAFLDTLADDFDHSRLCREADQLAEIMGFAVLDKKQA